MIDHIKLHEGCALSNPACLCLTCKHDKTGCCYNNRNYATPFVLGQEKSCRGDCPDYEKEDEDETEATTVSVETEPEATAETAIKNEPDTHWRDVDKEPPPVDTDVLILTADKEQAVAYYDGDEWNCLVPGYPDVWFVEDVTHWKPLPMED